MTNDLLFRLKGQAQLARDLVATLPEHLFVNADTTFLDPAMGGGQYLQEVVKRCLKYYNIEDILPRIYGAETTVVHLNWVKRNTSLRGANLYRDLSELADMKFDVIIGNPPYQKGTKASGNTLWDKFVANSLKSLKDGGYLSFITPCRWRQPEDALSYIYKDYQLVSLNINNVEAGKKVFKASTPFDVYTIQKTAPYKDTHIVFADGVEGDYDVSNFPFIPNSQIDFWVKSFSSTEEKLSAKWTYSHDPRQKHVFDEDNKPEQAIYPLTHTFVKDGFTTRFSTKEHEYQRTPKVIFGDAGVPRPIYDAGVYGCTQHSIFMPVADEAEGQRVIDFLVNNKEIIESMTFSQRQFGPKPLNFIPKSFI